MAWYDDMYMWTGLAVLMASAFIGLAYMLSQLLRLPILEAWVKVELNELVSSMIIAVFCVALIASVNGAAQFLTGSSSPDIITSTRVDFLRNELYADGQALYKNLVGAYFELSKVTSYSYSVGVTVGQVSMGYSSAPMSGLSPLQMQLGQGIDGVANFMLLAASQSAFLLFFGSAAAFMLPVGIFLRSFSLTRKVGGVVLAGVIAVSVIYPSSLLLTREIYDGFRPGMQALISDVHVKEAPDPPWSSVVCSDAMKIFVTSPLPIIGGESGWFYSFCWTIGQLPFMQFFCSPAWAYILEVVFFTINSLFPYLMRGLLILGVSLFESNNGWSSVMEGYYSPLYDSAMPAITQYAVLSLVCFIIPMLITLSLIRNLTLMFGGEPQLYGISKLV
ncbi:MAG: hypothetical protein WCT52_05635 [Candidatus Micrarchaeia archaeon]